jgi:hypothetical protein
VALYPELALLQEGGQLLAAGAAVHLPQSRPNGERPIAFHDGRDRIRLPGRKLRWIGRVGEHVRRRLRVTTASRYVKTAAVLIKDARWSGRLDGVLLRRW